MVNLASGLVASGKRVDFVLVRAEGEFMVDVPPGVRVIDLQARRAIAALPALVRYLRTERPGVLLAALDHANVIAVLAGLLSRASTCVVVSVHAPLSWVHGRDKSLFGKVFLRLIRWSYFRASAVVSVSEGVRHDLIQFLGLEEHKVNTIYNPIIDARLTKMGTEVPKHHWFESRQVPVILAVGRLSVEKDYPTLIRAFHLVRQQRIARLLILGEGEEKIRLKSLVNELSLSQDVEFTGFVANPFAFMKQASCYVISSNFEGFGNVIVEALAMGCCVVSTDCPAGPREILNGGEFGRMVPVGDVTAMAGAILQTINDGCCLSSLSLLNSHLQQFEIESVTQKYCDLFESITK